MKSNICIFGPVGTGKTTSLRTVVQKCKRELFVLSTSPGIEKILGDLPPERCHWHYIEPAHVDWQDMIAILTTASHLQVDKIISSPVANKSKFTQFIEIYNVCSNFIDDRTGKEYGPVDSFSEDVVFALDDLSNVSLMSLQFLAGAAILRTQPQWYGAQNCVEQLIRKLTGDCLCNFILLCHEDRIVSSVTGTIHRTLASLGNALSPRLAIPFDDVIYSYRKERRFYWSTDQENMPDVKTRSMEWANDIDQDFSIIIPPLEEVSSKPNGNHKKGKAK